MGVAKRTIRVLHRGENRHRGKFGMKVNHKMVILAINQLAQLGVYIKKQVQVCVSLSPQMKNIVLNLNKVINNGLVPMPTMP